MAETICEGFKAQDDRERDRAIDAFAETDVRQFAHLDRAAARAAAAASLAALWAKDDVEAASRIEGELDRKALARGDWGPVESAFRRRAEVVGMDPRYADQSTLGWRNHKIGRDYWTPLRRAQLYELRAAMEGSDYPDKPRDGQSGHGPEPARYALAVELHDMRTPEHSKQAVNVIQPYFEAVRDAH